MERSDMTTWKALLHRFAALSALASLLLIAGCETTDTGSTSTSAYYGVGFYDPWYHGDYYHDDDIVVTPPDRGPRPSHPIAVPPGGGGAGPRPTSMPSIPSMPRGGGGRR